MEGPVRQARVRALLRDRKGATAVEYGLILALVVLAVLVGISSLGDSVRERWNDITNKVTSA